MNTKSDYHIAIVGGGAAGFFSAMEAARLISEQNLPAKVTIFESSQQYLKKVKISGGGRCNVTHHLFQIKDFCSNYPRGSRELVSPFHQFQAQDTVNWFKSRGVDLITESDGRMFPSTHNSQTIIDCFLQQCSKDQVLLKPKSAVKSIEALDDGRWLLNINNTDQVHCNACLIATGSSPAGYRLAESLGHKITERAPSLFSFKIKDELIENLPGLSFDSAQLKLKLTGKKVFKQQGPVLITHWGLSGPAILKLSAWAARELKQVNYQAKLTVNWLGTESAESLSHFLHKHKSENSRQLLKNSYPQTVPKRFWLSLLEKLNINTQNQWAHLSKTEVLKIAQALTQTEFDIQGQNRFKEEFVECGGVSLKEIDFKTMQSKITPGVYFAGELLDVDGITGGFNFQNAWSTGWIAAQAMVNSLRP